MTPSKITLYNGLSGESWYAEKITRALKGAAMLMAHAQGRPVAASELQSATTDVAYDLLKVACMTMGIDWEPQDADEFADDPVGWLKQWSIRTGLEDGPEGPNPGAPLRLVR